MIAERTFEFDAFGPWIYRIEGEHTLPPLYTDYEDRLKEAVLCFKIPRQIERRKAHPRMNLYDAVIAVFRESLLVLEREEHRAGDRVTETQLPLRDITGICKRTCLLNGDLTLVSTERRVGIPFNVVSEDIISEAVGLIRKLISRRTYDFNPPELTYSLENMEIHFVHKVNSMLKEDPSLTLFAYQPSLEYSEPGKRDTMLLKLLKLREQVLSGFVLLCSSSELVIIRQKYFTKRPSSERYAFMTSYLPLECLKVIEAVSSGGYSPCLRLKTRETELILPAEEEHIQTILEGNRILR